MEKDEGNFAQIIELLREDVDNKRLNWYALSVEFPQGSRLAVHSQGAPKRPKGLEDSLREPVKKE